MKDNIWGTERERKNAYKSQVRHRLITFPDPGNYRAVHNGNMWTPVYIKRNMQSKALFANAPATWIHLFMDCLQSSKLSVRRSAASKCGNAGIVGYISRNCSARSWNWLYLRYTVQAWKFSCWTHITRTPWGDAWRTTPKPATSTSKDMIGSNFGYTILVSVDAVGYK